MIKSIYKKYRMIAVTKAFQQFRLSVYVVFAIDYWFRFIDNLGFFGYILYWIVIILILLQMVDFCKRD